jgi:hypothetical protein
MENCSPEEIHLDRGDRPVRTGGDSLEFTRWDGGDLVVQIRPSKGFTKIEWLRQRSKVLIFMALVGC